MLYGSTSSQPVSRIPKACLRLQVSEPGTEEAFQGESLTSVQRSCDISRSLGWSIRLELTSLALQGGVIDRLLPLSVQNSVDCISRHRACSVFDRCRKAY